MTGTTRDPRGKGATAAGTVTVTGLLTYALEQFAPNLTPTDVGMVLGGALLLWQGAGSMARDFIHEIAPSRASYLIRKCAQVMG